MVLLYMTFSCCSRHVPTIVIEYILQGLKRVVRMDVHNNVNNPEGKMLVIFGLSSSDLSACKAYIVPWVFYTLIFNDYLLFSKFILFCTNLIYKELLKLWSRLGFDLLV